MLAMEDLLCELTGEEMNEQGLPPGFRFHPTDEELITFYLASKVFHGTFCGVEIAEVDLNRCEPWELPDLAKMGEKEWYFFSLRDRKYPTGLRTNRATGAGYWKATGKDREVYSASSGCLLGMKKTLVFYKGRAPRGEKTKWVMHEYRLDGDFSYRHTCKEEWVICRIFHKTVDKKSVAVQGQGYHLLEASPPPTSGTSPPLLEAPTTAGDQALPHQNPFLIHHQENDLKSLINNPIFPAEADILSSVHGIEPSLFSAVGGSNVKNNSSPSMLFKSLVSHHQDCTWKEQQPTIYKQCKTEANFSYFQLPDASGLLNNWVDKIHPNPFQNPLFFEVDCNFFGFSSAHATSASDTPAHEMSTSITFNRTMLDPSNIRLPGESWPLDH